MLQELFASDILNVVYGLVVFVSFLFALLSLIGVEAGDALDIDVDVDVDGGLDFISISPFALALFGAAFGLTGLITRLWLELGTIPSILWSAGVGLIVGIGAQVFFIYVLSPTKSSHFSLVDDAIGREVEVITTIPGDGLGEIAYDNVSGRVKLGARSAKGSRIDRGEVVVIERITGRVAVVAPLETQ